MKVFLVNETETHEDAGREYETATTITASLSREKAAALAARGGWEVEEMELDQEFKDSWVCRIGFNGEEVGLHGPTPVTELPESGPDPWRTGCCWYDWTPEGARAGARKCYDKEIGPGYRKLTEETEERKKKLGL